MYVYIIVTETKRIYLYIIVSLKHVTDWVSFLLIYSTQVKNWKNKFLKWEIEKANFWEMLFQLIYLHNTKDGITFPKCFHTKEFCLTFSLINIHFFCNDSTMIKKRYLKIFLNFVQFINGYGKLLCHYCSKPIAQKYLIFRRV